MRTRLQAAPWWVIALVTGVTFGVLMTIWTLFTEPSTSFPTAVLTNSLAGLFFGLVMGPTFAWLNSHARAASGLDSRDEQVAALRTAKRGPAPADPQLRQAALRVAVHNEESNRRLMRFLVPGFVLVVIAYVVLAFFTSPWFFGAAVMFAVVAALGPWETRRLQRRVQVLSADGDPS